jgi:U3 small nucleolar ribonucleoprotein protein IMP4
MLWQVCERVNQRSFAFYSQKFGIFSPEFLDHRRHFLRGEFFSAQMDKRQNRLRREYLYRKALEAKEKNIYERKQQLKNALQQGGSIPRELKQDQSLHKDLIYDENQAAPSTHIDDEYFRAGEIDPKVLLTTSRDPSSRLTMFAKEMKLMFPNSQRMNRGNYVVGDIVEACRKNDATDLIILHETRGKPDGMVISHFPHGPTAYFTLHNVVLRHDIPDRGKVSEQYPHLIFDKFSSKLGQRVLLFYPGAKYLEVFISSAKRRF